jgi:excinuclease UvrABC nuclease subunit
MNGPREVRTGIYFLCKERRVIYVGQSRNILSRIDQHAESKDFDSVLIMHTPPDLLDEVEQYWIERIKPKLNGEPKIEAREQSDLDQAI